jgi:hypothetical protein
MSYTLPRRNVRPTPIAPEAFFQMADRLPSHGACNALRTALRGLATSYKEITDAQRRISNDRTATAAAQLVRTAKLARAKLDAAILPVRDAQAMAVAARADLSRKVNAPFDMNRGPDGTPRSLAEVLLAQEIRAHFNNLPRSERLAALQLAIDSQDDTVLRAICSVSPALSGTVPQMWGVARDSVIRRHAPGEAEALNALGEADEIGNALESALLQSVSDLIDFQTAGDFERNASESA